MKKLKFLIPYVMTFGISLIVLFGFYMAMNAGLPHKTIFLQLRRYAVCAVLLSISFALWNQSGRTYAQLISHAVVGLAWMIVYPFTYWLTFHQNTHFIDNHFDIAMGVYLFLFSTSLSQLLYHTTRIPKTVNRCILACIQTVLLLLPLLQIFYYLVYKTPLTEAAWVAVLQTNTAEAYEYLMKVWGIPGLGALGIVILALFSFFFYCHRHAVTLTPLSKKLTIFTVVLCLASAWYAQRIFTDTGAMWTRHQAQEYFDNARKFAALHDKNAADLQVSPSVPAFHKPSTIIMVIGESASRSYMSAYYPVELDTTPWMRTASQEANFILFRHAYTTMVQTVGSLERALTEKNQYNTMEFHESLTLLDIAKKAGYTTYWFSNQGTISNADTPITLVAQTADHAKWIEDELANSTHVRYDGDLLPYLKEINPNENNFVVIHIMGSHDNYANRYPPEFARWSSDASRDAVQEYSNSLAYTDWVLEQIYQYGKEHLNMQAMLYFSDHGAAPKSIRRPDGASFAALRIPMFLYLSDEYMQLYPATTSALRAHQDSYFTNDLIYEMICGILNIQSNHYYPANSIASPSYSFTRDTLTTDLGKKKLIEDIHEDEVVNNKE